MDLFENKIDRKKFRYTNAIWNELKLNLPNSVGYVTTLIESRPFQTKEEWRDFYYQSGQIRLKIAKERNIRLSSNTPQAKYLNQNYGRTEEELREKGRQLFQAIQEKGNPLGITLAECIYMVKYRVMGETWNGVIMREKNTIQTLQDYFPQCTFQKVSGKYDFLYAIDYEMYFQNQLLSAIQIKPISYQKDGSEELRKAKNANVSKNEEYEKKFGKKVFYVYSTNTGIILNEDVLQSLQMTIPTFQKVI